MSTRPLLWSCAVVVVVLAGCSTAQREPVIQSATKGSISEEAIGSQFGVAALTKVAQDPAYGYTEKVPVLVGGGFGDGGHNAYRYLNALLGPTGEVVHYTRVGTCCSFKTPNSPFDGQGLLEVYEISYEGGQPKRLYFNWYESGELLIPGGLTARK